MTELGLHSFFILFFKSCYLFPKKTVRVLYMSSIGLARVQGCLSFVLFIIEYGCVVFHTNKGCGFDSEKLARPSGSPWVVVGMPIKALPVPMYLHSF